MAKRTTVWISQKQTTETIHRLCEYTTELLIQDKVIEARKVFELTKQLNSHLTAAEIA